MFPSSRAPLKKRDGTARPLNELDLRVFVFALPASTVLAATLGAPSILHAQGSVRSPWVPLRPVLVGSPLRKARRLDRRAALKKLGASGMVVVGSSMIVSSPAFAFDSPVVEASPDFDLALDTIIPNNLLSVFRIRITSLGAATCPVGPSGPAGGDAELVTIFDNVIGQLTLTADVAVGTVEFLQPNVRAVGDLKGIARDEPFQLGDELTWTLEVTWRCTYGGVPRDASSSRTKTYRLDAIEPVETNGFNVTWTEVSSSSTP